MLRILVFISEEKLFFSYIVNNLKQLCHCVKKVTSLQTKQFIWNKLFQPAAYHNDSSQIATNTSSSSNQFQIKNIHTMIHGTLCFKITVYRSVNHFQAYRIPVWTDTYTSMINVIFPMGPKQQASGDENYQPYAAG